MKKQLYIGVIGRWDSEDPHILGLCSLVGEEIAKRGHVLVTGGGPGAMQAACQGAKRFRGLTVGFLAGLTRGEANCFVDIAIPTGLGFEVRSALLVRTSDVLILVGGANGSLGEVSMAYLASKPVIILVGSGGWADRLPGVLVNGKYMDERRSAPISLASSAVECVSMAVELARTAERTTRILQ